MDDAEQEFSNATVDGINVFTDKVISFFCFFLLILLCSCPSSCSCFLHENIIDTLSSSFIVRYFSSEFIGYYTMFGSSS